MDTALAAVPGRAAPARWSGWPARSRRWRRSRSDLPEYDPTRIHHARVAYDEVAKVTADLLAMTGRASGSTLPVMHPGRADVIGAGALILRVIMERSGSHAVVASEHDILDGIAYSIA